MRRIKKILYIPLFTAVLVLAAVLLSAKSAEYKPPVQTDSIAGDSTINPAGQAAMPVADVTKTSEIGNSKTDQGIKRATIAFTFDDGYLSDYALAYPILKKYGIRGTSYIIPKYQDNGTPYAMTWDQIREMAKYGWVFGCHTYAHTNLTKMTEDEIAESMEMVDTSFIKQGLPAPVVHAFPYGSYNQQAIDAIKPYRAQMRKAFYETKFVDLKKVNPYEIDCCSAEMRTEKRLKEHEALVDKACKENAVIVFRCHCLYQSAADDMGAWPVQTDSRLFKKLVDYCVEKGCRFVTMTELMEMYS